MGIGKCCIGDEALGGSAVFPGRDVFFWRYSFFGLPPMVYLKNIRVFFRLPRFVVHVLFDEERQGGTACCTR